MFSSTTQAFFEDAPTRIQRYNRLCLHYNFVADAVYQELRKSRAPFSTVYESYLIAALISFDMGRMMGKGLAQRYKIEAEGFAARLHKKLAQIKPYLEPITEISLVEVDIEKHTSNIAKAYDALAIGGTGGLNDTGNDFHVGATKILHFLNPELFAIVDSNTASTLRQMCGIPYRNTTQPGYSDVLYIRSLKAIRDLITQYGVEQFRRLESGTPLTRIFDKIAFASDSFVV